MITNHKYVSIVFACVECVCPPPPPPPLPTGHQQEGPAIQVWVCSGFLPANRDFSPASVTCYQAPFCPRARRNHPSCNECFINKVGLN